MSATDSTKSTFSPEAGSPAKLTLSVPSASQRLYKNCGSLTASPMTLNEATSCSSAERVISPKKKAKAEDFYASSALSKWAAVNIVGMQKHFATDDGCHRTSTVLEPIAFSAKPVGDLASNELQMLRHFLS
ncbi:hypothetical protein CCR75_005293 [Bremia lactucae]|uniref:Uncharacterized protein n=1 Tax=Bremia lactucae TaxID=4779 RepID=A0A976IGL7_BRELC|nr:hypothetical protein CCR75_005293 [Bremia lactucae]